MKAWRVNVETRARVRYAVEVWAETEDDAVRIAGGYANISRAWAVETTRADPLGDQTVRPGERMPRL